MLGFRTKGALCAFCLFVQTNKNSSNNQERLFAVLYSPFWHSMACAFFILVPQFVPGSPPTLKLTSDGGEEDTVAVQGWKVAQLEAFIQQRLNK
jgi:hypothetical protein